MTLGVLLLLDFAVIALHEAGHLAVARLLRVPARLRLRWYGVAAQVGRPGDTWELPAWKDLLIAAGGPAASAATAYALWNYSPTAAVLSALYTMVALVPVPLKCQDGYRMLLASARALAQARTRLRPGSRTARPRRLPSS